MLKRLLATLIAGFFICPAGFATNNNPVRQPFDDFKERFILEYLRLNPERATDAGYHAYDSVLTVIDSRFRKGQVAFGRKYLDSLRKFPYGKLTDQNKIDYRLIENELRSTIWQIDTLKAFEWDPSIYNVTGSFAYILNEPFDKLEMRLLNIGKKLHYVNAFYEAARANIRQPVRELRDLAIEQLNGGLSVFEQDLVDSLNASSLAMDQKTGILRLAKEATGTIQSFVAFLSSLSIENGRSFRLGRRLYEQQFRYEIVSSLTPELLYNAAMERKEYLLKEMDKRSLELWDKYFAGQEKPADRYVRIRKVIDTLSSQHAPAPDFRKAIEDQLPRLVKFVREKDLLYLDSTKPLRVRKEPGYMAGVAGASISAPGPYDKNGNTYYNVGTLEGWSEERAESYLREYNNYTLQILNIHEGIPGHYVQLVYSNNSPSIIKSLFGNGSMIEGWAVFSELLMMENGYDDSPEMWLMYYKWNLRAVCNSILDIAVHTRNMSKEEAMDLLTRQAFQQQAEAEGKWKRVSVTQVQLTSYFNGFYEIVRLREAYRGKKGNDYTDKAFVEKFLSYGSAPVRYISQLMLSE